MKRILATLVGLAVLALLLNRYLPVIPSLFPSTEPTPSEEPASRHCLIKGNITPSGKRIYHVPGQPYYDATQIDASRGERWFCTEAEAQAAGWRKGRGY